MMRVAFTFTVISLGLACFLWCDSRIAKSVAIVSVLWVVVPCIREWVIARIYAFRAKRHQRKLRELKSLIPLAYQFFKEIAESFRIPVKYESEETWVRALHQLFAHRSKEMRRLLHEFSEIVRQTQDDLDAFDQIGHLIDLEINHRETRGKQLTKRGKPHLYSTYLDRGGREEIWNKLNHEIGILRSWYEPLQTPKRVIIQTLHEIFLGSKVSSDKRRKDWNDMVARLWASCNDSEMRSLPEIDKLVRNHYCGFKNRRKLSV
jgi:hypothetical protein